MEKQEVDVDIPFPGFQVILVANERESAAHLREEIADARDELQFQFVFGVFRRELGEVERVLVLDRELRLRLPLRRKRILEVGLIEKVPFVRTGLDVVWPEGA